MHAFRAREFQEYLAARSREHIAAGGKVLADFRGHEVGIFRQTHANTDRHALHAFERAPRQRRPGRAGLRRRSIEDVGELDIELILFELRRVRDGQQRGRGAAGQQRTRQLAQFEDQTSRRGE